MAKIQTIPECSVELSEGEVIVRTYHITTCSKPKSRGDIAVTNKRIIYQGKGKTSTTVKEVPIQSVSAINTYCGSGFNFGQMVLGVLCVIVSLVFIATIFVPIIGVFLALGFFASSFNSGYSLSIKSSEVAGTGISVGSSDISLASSNSSFMKRLFSTSGQGAAFAVNAAPTKQALQMMNELGALVLDLKIMGDRAVGKWQGYQTAPVDTSVLNATLSQAVNLSGLKNVASRVQAGVQAGIQAGQQAGAGQQAPPPQAPQQQVPPQMPRQAPPPPPPMQTAQQQRFTPPPPPPPAAAKNRGDDGGFFG